MCHRPTKTKIYGDENNIKIPNKQITLFICCIYVCTVQTRARTRVTIAFFTLRPITLITLL